MNINNNINQTNFMALRIKPGAKEFLKSKQKEDLENLQKIGEKMKDYKYYDLEIDEKGYKILNKESNKEYRGNLYLSESHWPNTIEINGVTEDNSNVKEVFNCSLLKINTSKMLERGNSLYSSERYAAATELLEKNAEQIAKKNSVKKTEDPIINSLADDLISKFGVNV